MAEYALIDGYLDTMRGEIRWRKDLDDVVSEMEDHLYSTVEHLVARGFEPSIAQRTTLDRFGEPTVLAAVYASTPTGGLAVPTQTTRRTGIISLIAGAAWLAAAAIYFLIMLNDTQGNGDSWQTYYAIFSATILVAGVLTVLSMVGVAKRSGGLGVVGIIGQVITGLGVAASIIAWAVFLWMPLIGVGLVVFGVAALRAGIAPRTPTMLAAAGFIIGTIAFVALNNAEVGPIDSYGDYPMAWAIGGVIGMTIAALGLIGWGTWLRSEEPADIDPSAVPA